MGYTYLVSDPHVLVEYLANNLVRYGYHFWSSSWLPEDKDPVLVDAKLTLTFSCHLSRKQQARRRAAGHASVKYLRCGRLALLLATKGRSPFFEREPFKDLRSNPIHVAGYSVGAVRETGKVTVRLHRECQRELRRMFAERASWDLGWWQRWFRAQPWRPYHGVRDNLFHLVKHLNDCRKALRLPLIEFEEVVKTTFTPRPVFLDSPPELLELLRHEARRK